jgi:hypothetical protein
MFYRKLISVLVFAVFTFYFSGAARAQGCDNPDFCFDFGIPSTIDNFTGSNVTCTLLPGGTSNPINLLDIGTLGKPTAIFTQDGTADCKYIPNPPQSQVDLGTCQFHLEMSGVTTSTCNKAKNSFTAGAFCQDNTLQVTGHIQNCSNNPGQVLNLGIGGTMSTNGSTARNKNNCENVFPQLVDPVTHTVILPAGKVLDLTITTQGSPAGFCTGPYVAISNVNERWCNAGVNFSGNLIDFNEGPVNCVSSTGLKLTSGEANAGVVPFDFNVRQTVNTSTCKNASDHGVATIDIFGRNTFNVANVDLSSLKCEGAPLTGCTQVLNVDGFSDLIGCKVDTCPLFGPALADPNATTVTATCTGQLKSGTAILGTDDSVKIN